MPVAIGVILDAPAPINEAAGVAFETADAKRPADLNALLRQGATWQAS